MVFLNKIYFERVTIFTKSPRFLKPVTKTVPNVIKEATLTDITKEVCIIYWLKTLTSYPGITI